MKFVLLFFLYTFSSQLINASSILKYNCWDQFGKSRNGAQLLLEIDISNDEALIDQVIWRKYNAPQGQSLYRANRASGELSYTVTDENWVEMVIEGHENLHLRLDKKSYLSLSKGGSRFIANAYTLTDRGFIWLDKRQFDCMLM